MNLFSLLYLTQVDQMKFEAEVPSCSIVFETENLSSVELENIYLSFSGKTKYSNYFSKRVSNYGWWLRIPKGN